MTDKLNLWVQISTSVALIAGLGLVVWELQQARDATTAELYSQGFQIISEANNTVLGEQSVKTLLKACDAPDDLDREDLAILSTYYEELLNRQRRIQWIGTHAGFYSDDIASSTELGVWYGMFSSEPGRAYWEVVKVEPALRSVGDRALEAFVASGASDCGIFLDEWSRALDTSLQLGRSR